LSAVSTRSSLASSASRPARPVSVAVKVRMTGVPLRSTRLAGASTSTGVNTDGCTWVPLTAGVAMVGS